MELRSLYARLGNSLLELLKSFAETLGGIGTVFHNVGSEPEFSDSELRELLQYFKAVFHSTHTVIHSREQMTVAVGVILENLYQRNVM